MSQTCSPLPSHPAALPAAVQTALGLAQQQHIGSCGLWIMLFLANFPQVLANRNEVLVVVPFAGVGDCPFKLLKDLLRCCAGTRQKQGVEIIQAHYRRLCRGMLLRQFQSKPNRSRSTKGSDSSAPGTVTASKSGASAW